MGKRIKNIYDKALTYEKIYSAYIRSKKGKSSRLDVIEFNLNYEERLNEILCELQNLTYTFGSYNLFYIYEPKERKILAAPFRDRIIHTWYVENFLKPYFVPSFMKHSYACIEDRGMHRCALEVKKAIKKCSACYPCGYVLKMDISKYFENIDREILYGLICKKIADKKVLELTRGILDSTKDYDVTTGKSLPIGNYSSQMFANIYLNELDKYLKETLRLKYVYRYMDDIVIILQNKDRAKEVLKLITIFLDERLKLKLNSKTNIFKISQGVNFCGYKINVNKMKLRNRGKKKVVKKMKYIRHMLDNNNLDLFSAKKLLAGHVGYMKVADVSGIVKKYF